MRLIPFEKMVLWITKELKEKKSNLAFMKINFIITKQVLPSKCLVKSFPRHLGQLQDQIHS
jgi:hypothetical protein